MFGKRLKKLRENADINQEKLGNILGLSASTIGMYEQGRRQPDNETLIKVAEYFDVSTDYLLGKTDIKKYDLPYENETEKELYKKLKLLSEEEQATLNSFISATKKRIDEELDK